MQRSAALFKDGVYDLWWAENGRGVDDGSSVCPCGEVAENKTKAVEERWDVAYVWS